MKMSAMSRQFEKYFVLFQVKVHLRTFLQLWGETKHIVSPFNENCPKTQVEFFPTCS